MFSRLMVLAVAAAAGMAEAWACPPAGWDRARLEQLKAAKFEVGDAAADLVVTDKRVREAVCAQRVSPPLAIDWDCVVADPFVYVDCGQLSDSVVRQVNLGQWCRPHKTSIVAERAALGAFFPTPDISTPFPTWNGRGQGTACACSLELRRAHVRIESAGTMAPTPHEQRVIDLCRIVWEQRPGVCSNRLDLPPEWLPGATPIDDSEACCEPRDVGIDGHH